MASVPAKQNIPPLAPAPDPSRGVFETLLVRDGVAVELDAHLDRLAASLTALYGTTLPPGIAAAMRERARGLALGRLRAIVPPGLGAAAEIATEEVDPADFFPAPERGAELRTIAREGGLGPHKWADRRPLEVIPAPAVPLLLDRGDEVLEAARANVFAVRRGALFTPADDGRILPGIARAGAIAAAREAGIEVREEPLSRADLRGADEVFLTGSVRGVEPARSLDGTALPGIAELGSEVAAGLRRRWRTGRLAATRS